MAQQNPLDLLTADERKGIVTNYEQKVRLEREQETKLKAQLKQVQDNVLRWQQFIDSLTENGASTANSDDYKADWARVDKLFFAARNPQLLDKASLPGSEFVELLLLCEPDFLGGVDKDTVVRQIGAQLSSLAWKGRMMKLRDKQNKTIIHYLDPSWYVGKVLKPEHQHLLQTLEYVPAKSTAKDEDADGEENNTAPADEAGADENLGL